jgi:hypothetical protein
VEIPDANELIYEYKLVDVEVPVPAPPQAFAAFLSATAAPASERDLAAAAPREAVAPPDPLVQQYLHLSVNLMQASSQVRGWLETSEAIDRDPLDPEALQRQLRSGITEVVRAARLGVPGADSATLDVLWNTAVDLKERVLRSEASDAVKAQVRQVHDALSRLYPDAATLARQLADLRLGKLFLWSNDRNGASILRLSVKPRLGSDYHAKRMTSPDVGLNILHVRTLTSWLQSSIGLSMTPFSDRNTFHDRTLADTTFFDERPRERVTFTPTTFFSVEPRLFDSEWILGAGVGVGLRVGDDDLQLKSAIDYSVFLTGGYQFLRVHIGFVFSAEPDESALPVVPNPPRRLGTVDNRRLADFGTKRHRYVFIGLAFTPP